MGSGTDIDADLPWLHAAKISIFAYSSSGFYDEKKLKQVLF